MRIINYIIRNINRIFPSFRINTSVFNKIFITWTSKRLSFSSVNLKFLLERIYPSYLKVAEIKGCFVECGVGYGRSALIIESILQYKKDLRHFFLFDSFQGFPELSPQDITGKYKARKGQWNYINKNNLEEVLSCSVKNKSKEKYLDENRSRIHVQKGFFEDSLNQNVLEDIRLLGGISFLHLDVDLYQSYKLCLERLFPLVNSGGIILFDEYNEETLMKFPGSKKAVDEYLLSKDINPSEMIKKDLSGKCFYIKN